MAVDPQGIWNWMKATGSFTDYAIAGCMGNIFAESAYNSINLQNSYESIIGMTDEQYTNAVDNGTYTRAQFISDRAGYGLCQWTSSSRKAGLYDYAKSKKVSIGDMTMQLEFMYSELYPAPYFDELRKATDICTAASIFMLKYERPADQSAAAQKTRCKYGINAYDDYAGGGSEPPPEPPNPPTPDSSGFLFYLTIEDKFNNERIYMGTQLGNWIYFNDVQHYRCDNNGRVFEIWTGEQNWKRYNGFTSATTMLTIYPTVVIINKIPTPVVGYTVWKGGGVNY